MFEKASGSQRALGERKKASWEEMSQPRTNSISQKTGVGKAEECSRLGELKAQRPSG